MRKFTYDFLVIGGGSGGVRASRIAAQSGRRVALCEGSRLGGTCVIRGCVPKKLMVYASGFKDHFEDSAGFGWRLPEGRSPEHRWDVLQSSRDAEISRLEGVYETLLGDAGVHIMGEYATFVDMHTVNVGGKEVTADKILIATGGSTSLPSDETVPGIGHAITSDDVLESLSVFPSRVAIVGAGYIGCEFAGMFSGLGCEVHLIHRGDELLRGFDQDVRVRVKENMLGRGINVMCNRSVSSIANSPSSANAPGGTLRCHTHRAGARDPSSSDVTIDHLDAIVYATGRKPNVDQLNLDATGVMTSPDTRAIVVDQWSRTTVDNIYAVGDVTDRINLTPVAIAEGHALAETLFHNKMRSADHTGTRPLRRRNFGNTSAAYRSLEGGGGWSGGMTLFYPPTPTPLDSADSLTLPVRASGVPSAVFTQPPVACVGLTEDQAVHENGSEKVEVFESEFRPMKHTLSGRQEKTYMKLISNKDSGRVIGCHMVGDDAPEIMQGLAIAMKAGATKESFDSTIGIHPSAAEEFVTMRRSRPPKAS